VKKTPLPKSVTIETTLRCNLRCVHCVSRLRRAEYNGDMTPALLEKVRPLIEQAKEVSLDNQGEFFCNKDYLSIFRHARDSGAHTVITTNAVLLNDEIIDKVVFDGLTSLNFSIDGIDAETHEEFRVGSNFEKLISTIRKICARKQSNGMKQPLIGINTVIRRGNIEQLPAIVELARELGAHSMNVFHIFVFDRKIEKECLYHHQELSDGFLREVREKNRGGSLELNLPGLFSEDAKHDGRRFRKCTFPRDSIIIGARGEVFACCDWRLIMGSLSEESFEDIWNGRRYRQLRESVNSDNPHKICANCSYPHIMNVTNPASFFFWELPEYINIHKSEK